MENQFEQYEIEIISREVQRKNYCDIAFLLDRPVEEVSEFINTWLQDKGIISLQSLQDEKRANRPAPVKRERKPRDPKKKDPMIISRLILQDQKTNRTRRNEVRYVTKNIDYSKMKTVRIDEKTFVYALIDEDPEIVRKKYFANLKNKHIAPSQRGPTTEVKKFKPLN